MTEEEKQYLEEYIRLSAERERLIEENKKLRVKIKQQIKEFKYKNRNTVYKVAVVKRHNRRAIKLTPILPKRCIGCCITKSKSELDLSPCRCKEYNR